MIARKRLPPSKEAERESDQHFGPRKVGAISESGMVAWWVLRAQGGFSCSSHFDEQLYLPDSSIFTDDGDEDEKKRRKLSAFSLV